MTAGTLINPGTNRRKLASTSVGRSFVKFRAFNGEKKKEKKEKKERKKEIPCQFYVTSLLSSCKRRHRAAGEKRLSRVFTPSHSNVHEHENL